MQQYCNLKWTLAKRSGAAETESTTKFAYVRTSIGVLIVLKELQSNECVTMYAVEYENALHVVYCCKFLYIQLVGEAGSTLSRKEYLPAISNEYFVDEKSLKDRCRMVSLQYVSEFSTYNFGINIGVFFFHS
jgi:hypothetical protein